MSIFNAVHLTCSACSRGIDLERSTSVNAGRRPDYRVDILAGRFQATTCPGCGHALRIPPQLTYVDVPAKLWLTAQPASALRAWPLLEATAWQSFRVSYGDQAPPAAREVAVGMRPRLVFGWAAVREKLLCDDLGLDDLTLELTKTAVIRNVSGSPLSDQTELRLVEGDAHQLGLAWIASRTEEPLSRLSLPRELYDEVAADPEAWEAMRARIGGGLLVDLQRLLVATEATEATGA